MNKVIAQFKREFWESRASFVRTPFYLALLLVAVMLVGLVTTQQSIGQVVQGVRSKLQQDGDANYSITVNKEQKQMDPEFLRLLGSGQLFSVHPKIIGATLVAVATIFMLVFLLVQQSYLLSTLYSDRRDQSILFWKSLPVTETQNVLTKLATAVVVAPLGYMVVAVVAGMAYLFIMVGYAGLFLDMQIPGVGQILSALLSTSIGLVVAWLLFSLWAMPIFCWLLCSSALAKKAPFLISVTIPLSAAILEIWLLGSSVLMDSFRDQFKGALAVYSAVLTHPEYIIQYLGEALSSAPVWMGLVLSAGLVAGSVWLRNYRYEI